MMRHALAWMQPPPPDQIPTRSYPSLLLLAVILTALLVWSHRRNGCPWKAVWIRLLPCVPALAVLVGAWFWLAPSAVLARLLAQGSWAVLNLVGVDASLCGTTIVIGHDYALQIGPGCTGDRYVVGFLAFLVAAPGSWRRRLLIVGAGLLAGVLVLHARVMAFVVIGTSGWRGAHIWLHDASGWVLAIALGLAGLGLLAARPRRQSTAATESGT